MTAVEARWRMKFWVGAEDAPPPSCCDGWGEVRDGEQVVACPSCYPDAYEDVAP